MTVHFKDLGNCRFKNKLVHSGHSVITAVPRDRTSTHPPRGGLQSFEQTLLLLIIIISQASRAWNLNLFIGPDLSNLGYFSIPYNFYFNSFPTSLLCLGGTEIRFKRIWWVIFPLSDTNTKLISVSLYILISTPSHNY